jgi:hypothetical protein
LFYLAANAYEKEKRTASGYDKGSVIPFYPFWFPLASAACM